MESNSDYWKNPNNCGKILKNTYLFCGKRLTNSVLEYQYFRYCEENNRFVFSTAGPGWLNELSSCIT